MQKPTNSAQELTPRNRLSVSTSTVTATSPPTSTTSKPSKRPKSGQYHGPTSPAYSLAAAHIKFKNRKHADAGGRNGLRNAIGEESDSESDPEDVDHSDDDNSVTTDQLARPSSHQPLFRSLYLFHPPETVRLLRVYHEVIGELHPVCDIENLVKVMYQVQSVSSSSSGFSGQGRDDVAVDANDLLALNLALAIALIAEASPTSNIAHTIFKQCRGYIDAKVTSRSKSIKDVVVTLMTVCTSFIFTSWRQ